MNKEKIITTLVMIIAIIIATSIIESKGIIIRKIDQSKSMYEDLTDAILDGHFYINEKVDKKLTEMDNPYSPQERSAKGANYKLDYSLYKNHYYVYFGIVPALTTFLPYKIITGHDLYTYRSVQIFVTLSIIGMFMLLRLFKEKFFKTMSLKLFLLYSFTLSLMSIWHIILKPSTYCLAIASGICFTIWSIYFWTKACFSDMNQNKELLLLTIGNLFGALVFGCRPPIGFFNLLFIPVIIIIIKKREINKERILKILLSLIPYIIIISLLFIYNYIRFDNPFEFGKTYQLTIADSTHYITIKEYGIKKLIETIKYFCFNFNHKDMYSNGIFINFPISILIFSILKKQTRQNLKKNNLLLYLIILLISFITICILDSIYNFRLVIRYFMDVTWIISISTFICGGTLINISEKKWKIISYILCSISLTMVLILFINFPGIV